MNLSAADGRSYSSYIPRFVSEFNNATLLFTSDDVVNRRGAVMSYMIGKLIDNYLDCMAFIYRKISRVENRYIIVADENSLKSI